MKKSVLLLLCLLQASPAFGMRCPGFLRALLGWPAESETAPSSQGPSEPFFTTDHSLATPMTVEAYTEKYASAGLIRAATTARSYDMAGEGNVRRAFLVGGTGRRSQGGFGPEVVIGVARTRYRDDEPSYLHWLEITTDNGTFYIPFEHVLYYTRDAVP